MNAKFKLYHLKTSINTHFCGIVKLCNPPKDILECLIIPLLFVCFLLAGQAINYPKVRHSCISMVEENDTDTPTMSIHEIHPKSQNIFNSQIFKHSSTKICFKYVRLMPISLLPVKYGLWIKVFLPSSVSQALVRLFGYGWATFWSPNQNGRLWGVCTWVQLNWSARA